MNIVPVLPVSLLGISGLAIALRRWQSMRQDHVWHHSAALLRARAQRGHWNSYASGGQFGRPMRLAPSGGAPGRSAGTLYPAWRMPIEWRHSWPIRPGGRRRPGPAPDVPTPMEVTASAGTSSPAESPSFDRLRMSGNALGMSGNAPETIGAGPRSGLLPPAQTDIRPAAPSNTALAEDAAARGAAAPPVDEAAAATDSQTAGGHLPEWMTIREVCYETQLGQAYVRRQIQAGELPYAVFGKQIRVRRTDYEDWARQRQDATAAAQQHP